MVNISVKKASFGVFFSDRSLEVYSTWKIKCTKEYFLEQYLKQLNCQIKSLEFQKKKKKTLKEDGYSFEAT